MVADEEGGSQRPPPPRATPSQPEPILLAEKVAAAGSSCPIPFTHDRLFEAHHWWHEMAGWLP
jgi:hypothetical protein